MSETETALEVTMNQCIVPRHSRGLSWMRGILSQSRQFGLMLLGNVIYSACQWAGLIVLAKLGTPDDVGTYALGLAITAPVLVFANLQGRNLVALDVENRYSFGDYLGFRLISLALALLAIFGFVSQTQTELKLVLVAGILAVAQALDWTSETYFGALQKCHALDQIAASLMLKGPLSLALLTSAMYATHNLVWAVLALTLGRLTVVLLVDHRNTIFRTGPIRIDWKPRMWGRLLRSALPLGVISGMVAFNMNIPRYFIEAALSKRDLGIFAAVASLITAGNLVMAALASCTFVPMASAFKTRDGAAARSLLWRLFGTAALLGGGGVLTAVIGGSRLLSLLFRPEYGTNTGLFVRLMIVGALGYVISGEGYALTAARRLLAQIPLLLATIATTTVACWWLVPLRGVNGAAEAWMCGAVVQLAWGTALLIRLTRLIGESEAGVFEPALLDRA